MKPVSSLFTKILCWFFLNMVLVVAALAIFFAYQPQINLHAIFGQQGTNRLRSAGMLIAHDLNRVSQDVWPDILARHARIHGVEFTVALRNGAVHSSANGGLPPAVARRVDAVLRHQPPMDRLPPPHEPGNPQMRPGPDRSEGKHAGDDLDRKPQFHAPEDPPRLPQSPGIAPGERRPKIGAVGKKKPHRRMDRPQNKPHIMMRTQKPTRYWSGIRLRLNPEGAHMPVPAVLLAVSKSQTGNGFFFDPLPWMVAVGAVILISVLLWIPMVRNISRPLARMTRATESISKGRFDVAIHESRTDEIGRLAKAISHMASRLSAFVKGQKRFLGDVAHELGSPIARIQFGLGALEQRIEEENRRRLMDVMEDVHLMSKLVNELLAFSRADMTSTTLKLERMALLPAVQAAVQRERSPEATINVQIDPAIHVVASSDLLTRAVANLLRNATKYAGAAGPIEVIARNEKDMVVLEVQDMGPGVPEDQLDQLFEPFFRPEASRDRDSGGVGLGLAIVKTCVDACKGTVLASNRHPAGFVITIGLPT